MRPGGGSVDINECCNLCMQLFKCKALVVLPWVTSHVPGQVGNVTGDAERFGQHAGDRAPGRTAAQGTIVLRGAAKLSESELRRVDLTFDINIIFRSLVQKLMNSLSFIVPCSVLFSSNITFFLVAIFPQVYVIWYYKINNLWCEFIFI